MTEALTEAKRRLTLKLNREPPVGRPLFADQWVVNSLLQKSIRRGEVELAQRAAITFLAQRGSAIWRRFMIVAFEDVGAASPDAVAATVAVSSDRVWRSQNGGDFSVAARLAMLLADAPKSRSAEHLITAARHHPSLEIKRRELGGRSVEENLATIADQTQPLAVRGLAAMFVSGQMHRRASHGDLGALLEIYRHLAVPKELMVATGIATARIRDPITLMVPLIWLASNEGQGPRVLNSEVPPSPFFGDVPMYALDKHTRVGREAIRNLVGYSSEVRQCLNQYVPPGQWNEAGYMASFYADAAPLARRLIWDGADELERTGTEADMLRVGVSPKGITSVLKVFRANVSHLNDLRARAARKKLGLVDAAQALAASEAAPE